MNYDKNSFLSGIAVGRQLKGWSSSGVVETGDLCILYPVVYSIEIKRPYDFSDTATPLYEGVNTDVLTLSGDGIVFHGVTVFSDAAVALAEELNNEQHDISSAYLYIGEIQEVSMNSENTSENLNDEYIAVTNVTMEVDT